MDHGVHPRRLLAKGNFDVIFARKEFGFDYSGEQGWTLVIFRLESA